MDNLKIRKACSSDVNRIVELGLLLQKHVEGLNPLIWRITEEGEKLITQKVEADVANNSVLVLLAETDGEVIGYVQGEIMSRNDHLPRTVGHVSLMYVVKQFRRKGVGRRLMKELCKFFISGKAETLTVRYVIGNKEAEGFWTKLGFESIIMTSSTPLGKLETQLNVMID